MALASSTSSSDDALRGDIWFTELDPVVGDEIQKTRPCVIISADGLKSLKVKLVVPIREWKSSHDNNPWYVPIEITIKNGLTKKSTADVLQTRCVSTDRLNNKSGFVSAEVIQEIVTALASIIEYV